MKYFSCYILMLFILVGAKPLQAGSQNPIFVDDMLSPLPRGTVVIGGHLGEKLNSCVRNGVMLKDYNLYIKPFSDRSDDPNRFQGEFWGKWFTSAALAYNYQPTAVYRKIIDRAAEKLVATQTADGKISAYKNDFGDWDIWGRKYALLGLTAHYDQTGNEESLKAASRALEHIISIAGRGKQKLTETGLPVLEALSSSSVLEPVVLLYQRTGNRNYLDFAEYLVSLWSQPNKYTARGIRLIEDALSDTAPIHISSAKGYEEMSCYEGLCELYRVTGDKKYLNAVISFAKKVVDKEIMIVGSGSSGELWCDGAVRQTELLEQPMETCVTATWIKFCYQLLRLTGDSFWADQMELTLYNALLGAMIEDGKWWAYFSPLMGERMPSPMQVPTCNSSCCIANGPRGLLTVPGWSVMKSQTGPVVNIYSDGQWKYDLSKKNKLIIEQSTGYPRDESVRISVHQDRPANYTIKLRIPEWSKKTIVKVNNEIAMSRPGSYLDLTRNWRDGDVIEIKFDMRGRLLKAPGNPNQIAIMRGPIVLTMDSRFVKEDNYNLWLLHDGYRWKHDDNWNIDYALLEPSSSALQNNYIDLKPVDTLPAGVQMAFEVPFLYRPTHFFNHKKMMLILCDYASAGNRYSNDNYFRVWIPQPVFMNYLYPKNSWKILYEGDQRSAVPDVK